MRKCRKNSRSITRESRHKPNWNEVEILAKENNIVKQKFKESVEISEEKKDSLLNKNEESNIWTEIITQIKVN